MRSMMKDKKTFSFIALGLVLKVVVFKFWY